MVRNQLVLIALMASTPAIAQQAVSGIGGEMRVLDKVTGDVTSLQLSRGETQIVGSLRLTLDDCRYPASNPSGDAYAAVTVHYRDTVEPIFAGWLLASAPALNAMDHPRYDVWVMRCTTS